MEQTHSRTYIVQYGSSFLWSLDKDGHSMKRSLCAVFVLRPRVCKVLFTSLICLDGWYVGTQENLTLLHSFL